MDITSLQSLAEKSPALILTVLGLYLFKTIVNDIRHDIEGVRRHMSVVETYMARIAESLDRIERRMESR